MIEKNQRIITVSNRLPVTLVKTGDKITVQKSSGGLATGIAAFYKKYDSVWVGWPGLTTKKTDGFEKNIKTLLKKEKCFPVFLSKYDLDNYYHGFSNKTVWPLFHYFPILTQHNHLYWEAYKRVNQKFCDTIVKIAKDDDIIWIHDYHLMLLPRLLREKLPNARIIFFMHIPFPSFEIFRILPHRHRIIKGILGADLIGFHTYDYVHHFLESARRISGFENSLSQINVDNRVVLIDAFPLGIDFDKFQSAAKSPDVKKEVQKLRKKIGQRKIILSVDRLDYTKGIPERLEAFDLLLEKNPHLRGTVTYIVVAVPSRTAVESYVKLKQQVDELVGRINGKYGALDWVPIWYLYRTIPFNMLIALYNIADSAVVTPLRDGMNLVAKEFLASKTDNVGALVLSEMAGAASELGEAVIVNPYNKENLMLAIEKSLTAEENWRENLSIMQSRLRRYDTMHWATDILSRLNYIDSIHKKMSLRHLSNEIIDKIVANYKKSKHRLILLDYDGTLVPFANRPEDARPDKEVYRILRKLNNTQNDVVIISGRDRYTLDTWFNNLNINMISEHGAWIKDKNHNWAQIEPLSGEWKEQIRQIMETYVDRTPGSFIEEKEFSLVWHFRKANYIQGSVRARELKEALINLTANMDIGVLEGNMVIEVKKVSINKGHAVETWLKKKSFDFILAFGDDWTDEDMFCVLPHDAFSVKIGYTASAAHYHIDSYKDVRNVLKKLIKITQ